MTLTSLPFYRIFSNLIYIYPTPYGILLNSAIQLRVHMIGTYEYLASKILQKELKDARLFIDVGAHVGYYTLLASKIAKEVIALEPDPFNYKLLRINLRINGISNAYALNIAASNYTGTGIFASIKNIGKLLAQKSNLDNNINKIKIRVVKLDDLLLKIGKNPDVMKIDVEGSEMQVLEGLQETLRKGVKCLMIEVHSEENKAEVISFLKSLGYKIISLKTLKTERRELFNEFLICKSLNNIQLNLFVLENIKYFHYTQYLVIFTFVLENRSLYKTLTNNMPFKNSLIAQVIGDSNLIVPYFSFKNLALEKLLTNVIINS